MISESELKPGMRVSWTSAACGYAKTKTGTIVARVKAGTNIDLSGYAEPKRLHALTSARLDRVLIRLDRKPKGDRDHYYAPPVSFVMRGELLGVSTARKDDGAWPEDIDGDEAAQAIGE
jgi:hypothetical protein